MAAVQVNRNYWVIRNSHAVSIFIYNTWCVYIGESVCNVILCTKYEVTSSCHFFPLKYAVPSPGYICLLICSVNETMLPPLWHCELRPKDLPSWPESRDKTELALAPAKKPVKEPMAASEQPEPSREILCTSSVGWRGWFRFLAGIMRPDWCASLSDV